MMKVRTISVADYAKIKWKVKATENEADFTPHCSTIEVCANYIGAARWRCSEQYCFVDSQLKFASSRSSLLRRVGHLIVIAYSSTDTKFLKSCTTRQRLDGVLFDLQQSLMLLTFKYSPARRAPWLFKARYLYWIQAMRLWFGLIFFWNLLNWMIHEFHRITSFLRR